MNILQVLPKLNVGGVEKGTIEVARYLTLKGHKAVVVSAGGPLEKKLAAIGARHYTLPVGRKNPFNIIGCYFQLKRIIRKENIDIVHARSRVPAISAYFAARATRKIFITTAHGQYKKHLISRVMGWGKVVIAANETMARHMKDNFNVPFRKIRIIPRGVDLEKFAFRLPSSARGKDLRIGMICRFTPLKGHLDFLKAASYVARRVPNLKIVLMGDRSSAKEEYIAKIDLNIRRLMLEKIVEFKGSDQDVAEVMGGLDVLVSANREQEAFGRTVIEAQARGVPVVATRIGGVTENVCDGETGIFCEPGDPRDMADKILKLAEDKALADRIAEGARKFVEENYSLEKTMRMKLDVYSKVLSTRNILVIKISALGDIILSIPSFRALRKRFKDASIKALVDVRFRDILENCPYIDEVISCDLKGRDSGPGFLRLANRLRAEDIDISVDLQNNRKSHLLAFLGAIPERYGYDNGKWSILLNRRISMPKKAIGPVEHQAVVLGLLGITGVDKKLELWTSAESDEWAEGILESSWLKKGQKLVAFSLSASAKWKTKNWPLSYMVQLADDLASEKGIRVVLIGSSEHREEADQFMELTGSKPIDVVGRTSLSQLISVIKKCDALLTGDSAPLHIAAACGTPFVALFGPTSPERHIPTTTTRHKVLRTRLRCSPCYSQVCLRKQRCLRSIRPEQVFGEILGIMGLSGDREPERQGSRLS